ncbi:MAG TPA: TetR/AcrR family transcriptional regulator [Bacillota bacterium]|nr:TetR/AcrR family transcriptional regulator [Bacillota bacterium]
MAKDKEREIVDAAVALFRDKGYHATSMQDIADAVGLQKGSLYHYLESKEELLYRIALETISAYIAQLEAIAGSDLPRAEKLRQAVDAHVRMQSRDVGTVTLLRDSGALEPEQRQVIRGLTRKYAELVEAVIEDGISSGEFRGVDAKMATFAILGACNWIHRWYAAGGRLQPGEISAAFSDFFLTGLGVS